MSGVESETLVRVEELPGRGRALVSSIPLKGGQIVLGDSPILLYSTFPLSNLQNPPTTIYCDHCFRKIPSAATTSCPGCTRHHFCNPNCLSLSMKLSHSPWVCQALSRLCNCPSLLLQPQERQVQARFLIAAYSLALVSPSNFQTLLSLQGHGANEDAASAQFLHSLISTLCPPVEGLSFSLELTLDLLAKDKLNAFGLMEPLNLDGNNSGQISIRAYGIYPKASFINHDCLPNSCRFDYVDTAPDNNTDIIVRMIHDVPQGREICMSYFPVNLNYFTRQKILLEDYGFTCDCDRCKVEANWSDEDGDGENENTDEAMDQDQDESMETASDCDDDTNANNDFPHAYFFLKYMCSRENCGGTLAPLPPSDVNPSNLFECNVCGDIKIDEVADANRGKGGFSMDD